MNEEKVSAYFNGKIIPWEEAKIPLNDLSFVAGGAVFEAFAQYDGKIFKLDEHLDRLYHSCHYVGINMLPNKQELREGLLNLVKKNHFRNYAYIRVVVTQGISLNHTPPGKDQTVKPNIIIINIPRGSPPIDRIWKMITSTVRRIPPQCLDPRVKSINYLNNALAQRQATNVGADTALMLDIYGFVAEAAYMNIFIVHDNEVFTPYARNVLNGITRRTVIGILKELGYATKERNMTLYEVYNADEIFLTQTSEEVVPVIEVDGRVIGNGKPGPITKQVIESYQQLKMEGTPAF